MDDASSKLYAMLWTSVTNVATRVNDERADSEDLCLATRPSWLCEAVDPWFCVTVFQRFCLFLG